MPRLIISLDLPDSAAAMAPDAIALSILGTSAFKHDAVWADAPDATHLSVVANAIGYELALHLGRTGQGPNNRVNVTPEEAEYAQAAARRALTHLAAFPVPPAHQRAPAPGYCNTRPTPDSPHICDIDPRHTDGTCRCRCGATWPTPAR